MPTQWVAGGTQTERQMIESTGDFDISQSMIWITGREAMVERFGVGTA